MPWNDKHTERRCPKCGSEYGGARGFDWLPQWLCGSFEFRPIGDPCIRFSQSRLCAAREKNIAYDIQVGHLAEIIADLRKQIDELNRKLADAGYHCGECMEGRAEEIRKARVMDHVLSRLVDTNDDLADVKVRIGKLEGLALAQVIPVLREIAEEEFATEGR